MMMLNKERGRYFSALNETSYVKEGTFNLFGSFSSLLIPSIHKRLDPINSDMLHYNHWKHPVNRRSNCPYHRAEIGNAIDKVLLCRFIDEILFYHLAAELKTPRRILCIYLGK